MLEGETLCNMKKGLKIGSKLSPQVLLLQRMNPGPRCWVGGSSMTISGSLDLKNLANSRMMQNKKKPKIFKRQLNNNQTPAQAKEVKKNITAFYMKLYPQTYLIRPLSLKISCGADQTLSNLKIEQKSHSRG